jgi:hypothetical protein
MAAARDRAEAFLRARIQGPMVRRRAIRRLPEARHPTRAAPRGRPGACAAEAAPLAPSRRLDRTEGTPAWLPTARGAAAVAAAFGSSRRRTPRCAGDRPSLTRRSGDVCLSTGGAGAFDSSLPAIVASPSNRLKAAHQSLSARASAAETTNAVDARRSNDASLARRIGRVCIRTRIVEPSPYVVRGPGTWARGRAAARSFRARLVKVRRAIHCGGSVT